MSTFDERHHDSPSARGDWPPLDQPSELVQRLRNLQWPEASSEARQRCWSELAQQVAQQLMAKDALAAHARDELGISEVTTARPVQAALTSAATFAAGAAMPLLMVVVSPSAYLVPMVSLASLIFLGVLGAVGAKAGGADVVRATARVTFWGALAMAATAGIGKIFGTIV